MLKLTLWLLLCVHVWRQMSNFPVVAEFGAYKAVKHLFPLRAYLFFIYCFCMQADNQRFLGSIYATIFLTINLTNIPQNTANSPILLYFQFKLLNSLQLLSSDKSPLVSPSKRWFAQVRMENEKTVKRLKTINKHENCSLRCFISPVMHFFLASANIPIKAEISSVSWCGTFRCVSTVPQSYQKKNKELHLRCEFWNNT